MKTAIKHNLLLLRRTSLLYILFIAVIFLLQIRDGSGIFILIIPILAYLTTLTLEDYDKNKENILLSLPVSRIEYAKAKLYTLFLIYGAITLILSALYLIYFIRGIAPFIPPLVCIFEIVLAFPLSILFVGLRYLFKSKLQILFPVIMINVLENINLSLILGDNNILAALLILLMLILSRFTYVLAKENYIRAYTEMEI
jgi:hypothetical protein